MSEVAQSSDSYNELRELANNLPLECCDYAFAYGSGVVKQSNSDPAQNMIDLILVVPDAHRFHAANLVRNRSHYSAIRMFGAKSLARYQNHWAANIYFNTMVRITKPSRLIKYGVIETGYAIGDLLDWDHLYLSGRLHKPITPILTVSEDSALSQALYSNLQSAVHCALLLLPQAFTQQQLFTTITALSYAGDFRRHVGEDQNKVTNIVRGSQERFDRLYSPILRSLDQVYIDGAGMAQDMSPAAIYHHLNMLPRRVLWNIHSIWRHRRHGRYLDVEDVIYELAHNRQTPSLVKQSIEQISRTSSFAQTLKNIPTAGAWKSLLYAGRKMNKMIRSLR